MPDEAATLAGATNAAAAKAVLTEIDAGFATKLEPEELDQIVQEMK